MNTQITVSDIQMNEIEKAAVTLFHAFKNDPLMKWVFGDENLYQEKAVELFETWVKYCVLYGKAFKTNNFEAVALRRKPGDIKFTLWRIFRSGMLRTPQILGKNGFDRLMQFDKIAVLEKQKNMEKKLFWYCWMIGTDPKFQKQGFGSALMAHTFAIAKQDNLPCYLETSSEASKQVHLSKGYKILSEVSLPRSDFKIISMLNELA